MSRISKPQQADLRRLMGLGDNDFDWAVAYSLDPATVKAVEDRVREAMAREGKVLPVGVPHGAESMYGGEFARRVLQQLLAAGYSQVMAARDLLHEAVCVKFEYCKKRAQK